MFILFLMLSVSICYVTFYIIGPVLTNPQCIHLLWLYALNISEPGVMDLYCSIIYRGYESSWLVDLVASHILDNTKNLFKQTTEHYGIYRDYDILFRGSWKTEDVTRWLKTFQIIVNDLLNSEKLVFTTKIWIPREKGVNKTTKITKKNSVIECHSFPLLDMEMSQSSKGNLRFEVHLKPNQQLKYLNKGRCHTTNYFRAFLNGVITRLSKLTSATRHILESKLDTLYPHHAEALRKLDLAPSPFPKMVDILAEIKDKDKNKEKEKKRKKECSPVKSIFV